ncbi:MAG TPA: glycosyl hydrolase family 28-related protein [Capsulimonadaceae bacterium]|jgi:hypothetical protein
MTTYPRTQPVLPCARILLAVLVGLLIVAPYPALAAAPINIPVLDWQPRSDWVNVKTGATPAAVGDGVADDTAAIQAAFDRISDKTGEVKSVYFPAGTYRITKTVTISKVQGALIIGTGRTTRLVWDGEPGGRMYWSNGVSRSRYIGLVWDGAGKADVGIEHASDSYYETRVRHRDEAFVNFRDAGILLGKQGKTPSAEMEYYNCQFDHCGRGVALVQWNYYDNRFSGCEFTDCGVGLECQKGNFYLYDSRFVRSTNVDIFAYAHSHSVIRCVSSGSAQFIRTGGGAAGCLMMVQDCRVDKWTGANGAIEAKMRGPLVAFDCVFTNPPDAKPAIRLANGREFLQPAVVSCNLGGIDAGVRGDVLEVPAGSRSRSLITAATSFLSATEAIPGRVFDAKLDFGAKGDNRTDDTDAIAKTIAAARAAGKGAIAYLPTGSYAVSRTLDIGGADYWFGGNGYRTILRWTGAAGGTVVSVRDTKNVTLEQFRIDAPVDVAHVLQTSSGGVSSVACDGIYVGGSWIKPTGPDDSMPIGNGGISKSVTLRGLECVGLPAGATVRIRHWDGSMSFKDCAAATILTEYNIDGTVKLSGTAPKTGFIGYLARANSGNIADTIVEDNNDLVMGSYYTEQTIQQTVLRGKPGQKPGRVTLHCSKAGTEDKTAISVDNFSGAFTEVGAMYNYESPFNLTQTGSQPVDILQLGCAYWKAPPTWTIDTGGRLCLLQNIVAGLPVTDPNLTVENQNVPAGLKAAALALDDFRRLGEYDLKLNFPQLSAAKR